MDYFLCCVALAALAHSVQAVPGTFSLPVELHGQPQLIQRATGPKKITLINNQKDMSDKYYGIKVEVGTPPQELTLALNTRSSDTCFWTTPILIAQGFSKFKPEKSTTFINGSFGTTEVTYGDPTTYPPSNVTYHLNYFEDVFRISGATIPNQRFGIPDPEGGSLLSIGPNLQLGYGAGKPFNTIVDNLVTQGVIASRTYSLDLRTFDDNKGQKNRLSARSYAFC
ncbi:rhizopuspepsin-1 [Colletotrichum liriopes]|uniref:Rhizopuspepsin-1 n=1 Tax=Colletotrichum liriopes TaxID=708192 RepID=A0AA37GH72_9PEZI|nr:rhizopuspepsin-1 [Colletotrichum liriopes]